MCSLTKGCDGGVAAFQFVRYVFNELSFVLNTDVMQSETGDLENTSHPISLWFQVNIGLPVNERPTDKGRVILSCFIDPDEEHVAMFTLKAVMVGYFRTEQPIAEAAMRKFLEINGVTAMFPFLRSAIADLTRSSGIDPLILPMVNVPKLIKEHRVQMPSKA